MDVRDGLSFLIVLAAMPMAGCPSDDDDGTTLAGTTTTSAGTSSDTTTSSTGTDTGSSTSSTGFPPSDSSSTTSAPDLCMGAPMPLLCEDYGDHFVDCFPDDAAMRDAWVHDCVCGAFYAAIYTEACGAAAEDYYTCVIAAPCEELMNDPCPTEAQAFVDSCGGHSPPDLTG